mmetsp:Transcript_27926/g.54973  ORF Transcript_27926/g.54973 Transcript_27926/m.54973 type:complete len:142 (+) Transcript_27926:42-467(+)|eukprot:CAMPEP_0175168930 /NCGR_PEP_ID=MMETSP0087-20121206/29256_1 /TAXON_ID=136419 /ORGANISM="Unknown Unknown, Strain D1" /LENGTH=141 /DNA_ID=CAMNT_0016459155 /DNA_START=37 /DNA_END=462 /DNA_ORIENTATION=+
MSTLQPSWPIVAATAAVVGVAGYFLGTSATKISRKKKQEKFCLNVTLYVKPEKREQCIKAFIDNQNGTLSTEPLCLQYTWGESTTQPNTFHFQEAYKGEDGFKAHTQTPHFKRWEEVAKTEPFSKPPEVSFFVSMGDDSQR